MSARWGRASAVAVAVGVAGPMSGAAAADETEEEERGDPVSGIVREETEPGELARDLGSAALFLPRETLGLMFVGTSMAAAVLQDESTVPRFANVGTGEARLYVFPTLFAETESTVSVGARMIGASDHFATSFRAGIGGLEDTVVESRAYARLPTELPIVVGLETFFSRASALELEGIGQVPDEDPRNRFAEGRGGESGFYDEGRQRGILSLGVRPTSYLEILSSVSADLREVEATGDPAAPPIDVVFEPGTVRGSEGRTRLWYAELSLRLDTRPARGGPQEGFLAEVYGGASQELPDGPPISLARVGGSATAFLRVLRRSNVIVPRMSLDGLVSLSDAGVPFTELPRQPEFRGAGDRLDLVSWVGSVDYRWAFASVVGARLFADTATVGPSLGELAFADLRWALGAGLDLWSTGSDLGSVAVAGGPDGVNLQVTFGVASGFGDRQHRD